jgi:hypothetical protein
VGADKADENCLQSVFNLDNKSVFIATDIEHHSIVGEKAGCCKHGLDCGWLVPASRFGKSMLGLEWLFSIAMA